MMPSDRFSSLVKVSNSCLDRVPVPCTGQERGSQCRISQFVLSLYSEWELGCRRVMSLSLQSLFHYKVDLPPTGILLSLAFLAPFPCTGQSLRYVCPLSMAGPGIFPDQLPVTVPPSSAARSGQDAPLSRLFPLGSSLSLYQKLLLVNLLYAPYPHPIVQTGLGVCIFCLNIMFLLELITLLKGEGRETPNWV